MASISNTTDRVALLAKLISSRRRGSSTVPYTLFIGAGVSLGSGPSVFADIFAELSATDYGEFSERVKSLSADERFALLRPRISVLTPSPGALLLAKLALSGYFSLILTTNFDDLIERSLGRAGATTEDFTVYVNGPGSPAPDLNVCVSRPVPAIHIVKLHGDVFKRVFALTDEETIQFSASVEDMLKRHFAQNDCIVLGSSMRDFDLLRCFGSNGGSIWYVNPSPPQEYFVSVLKRRNCSSCVISGKDGEFEIFMEKLAAELTVSTSLPTRTFSVESHRFVPVFLGTFEWPSAVQRTNRWGAFLEVRTQENARLCIFPFGVAVWHLIESERFGAIADVAINRRQIYSAILSDHNSIVNCNQTRILASRAGMDIAEGRSDLSWKLGYVFSLLVLRDPIWRDTEFHNALKMLACPTVLQADDKEDLSRPDAIRLEQELLRDGFSYPDLQHFGVPGRGFGYASWAGLSYFAASQNPAMSASEIADYEVVLQAVWWSCHCLKELSQDSLSADSDPLRRAARLTRRQLNTLKGIGPTEGVDLRTMEEAIVRTSRVCEMAEDALDPLL